MKKLMLILVAAMLLISNEIKAQNKGYEGIVNTNILLDMCYDEMFLGAKYTNGYRFNKYIFIGGGAGFFIATKLGDDDFRIGTEYNSKILDYYLQFIVPVFSTIKVNFTEKRVSPFFLLDLGYNIGNSTNYNDVITSGFFIFPNFGMDVNIGDEMKYAFIVQAGVNFQANTNIVNSFGRRSDVPRCKFSINFGFKF